MDDNKIIGIYISGSERCPIYYDEVSGEYYYEDAMGGFYLINGFNVDETHDLSEDAAYALLDDARPNVFGIIPDGAAVWTMTDDNMATKTQDGKVLASVAYSDDMEYEPDEDAE